MYLSVCIRLLPSDLVVNMKLTPCGCTSLVRDTSVSECVQLRHSKQDTQERKIQIPLLVAVLLKSEQNHIFTDSPSCIKPQEQ